MSEAPQKSSEAKQVNVVAGVVLATTALSCIAWLIPNQVSSDASPGDLPPTMVPYLAAGIVLVLALGLVLQTIVREARETVPIPGRLALVELFIAAAATALILAINNNIGFLVMSVTLTASAMLFSGGRSWPVIAIVSIGFPVLVWLGAWYIFTVSLP